MRLYTPQDGRSARELSECGEEVWVPIRQSSYFISNLGRVYRVSPYGGGDFVSLHPSAKQGYLMASLRRLGKQYVHRLVLEAFEGADPGRAVFHISANLKDNRLCNLERREGTKLLSEATKQALQARLLAGDRPSKVAREFGISSSLVSYYKRKLATGA